MKVVENYVHKSAVNGIPIHSDTVLHENLIRERNRRKRWNLLTNTGATGTSGNLKTRPNSVHEFFIPCCTLSI